MKRIMTLLFFLVLTPVLAVATTFETIGTYGGTGAETLFDAIYCAGSFLLMGTTTSIDGDVQEREYAAQNNHDAWAVCVDNQGTTMWNVLIDQYENQYEQFTGATETPDGRILLFYTNTGYDAETNQGIYQTQAYTVDANGKRGDRFPVPTETQYIYPLSDGLMAAWTEDAPLAKGYEPRVTTLSFVDWDGAIAWQKAYVELSPMRINDSVESKDGYWLIGSWREDKPYSGAVVQLNKDGEIKSQTVLPATAYGGFRTGVADGSGGMIVGGTLSNTMDDESLLFYGHAARFNADGTLLWSVDQRIEGYAVEYSSMVQKNDLYILHGHADIQGMNKAAMPMDGKTAWLWAIDSEGNTQWELSAGYGYGGHVILSGADDALYIANDGNADDGNLTLTKVLMPE